MFPFILGYGVAVCTSDFGSTGECSTHSIPTILPYDVMVADNTLDVGDLVRIRVGLQFFIGQWCNGSTP